MKCLTSLSIASLSCFKLTVLRNESNILIHGSRPFKVQLLLGVKLSLLLCSCLPKFPVCSVHLSALAVLLGMLLYAHFFRLLWPSTTQTVLLWDESPLALANCISILLSLPLSYYPQSFLDSKKLIFSCHKSQLAKQKPFIP